MGTDLEVRVPPKFAAGVDVRKLDVKSASVCQQHRIERNGDVTDADASKPGPDEPPLCASGTGGRQQPDDRTAQSAGDVIHDAWSARLEKVGGPRNAHHLRELVAVTDLDGHRWWERMTNLPLEMMEARNTAVEAGRTGLEPERIAEFEQA